MKRIVPIILTLAVSTLLLAQPRPGGPPPGGGPRGGDRLVEMLQLDDAQKASWRAAREAFDQSTQATRDEIHSTHEKLDQLMEAKSNDAAAIGNLMIAIRNLDDQMKAAHEALDAKLAATLTPDQKTKFEQFIAAGKARGRRPGPPPPMER